jgi:small GTP-binding protein
MERTLKIVVTGPFSAGKTEFIKAVSDIEVITTERKLTRDAVPGKEETTVALDYGRTKLGDMTILLFGTPGQPRFDFMWEILAKEMDGFVVMVDSADLETFGTAKKLIKMFRGFENVPYIIAANKQDLDGAISPQEMRSALGLEPKVKVAQCVATDPLVIKQILLELTKEL